eukprot:2425741-Prymnesium_polylepis.2
MGSAIARAAAQCDLHNDCSVRSDRGAARAVACVARPKPDRGRAKPTGGEIDVRCCAWRMLPRTPQILSVPRQQLSLSRGWSQRSKFLIVSNAKPVDVFKAIRGS